jgi:hypothetical protein
VTAQVQCHEGVTCPYWMDGAPRNPLPALESDPEFPRAVNVSQSGLLVVAPLMFGLLGISAIRRRRSRFRYCRNMFPARDAILGHIAPKQLGERRDRLLTACGERRCTKHAADFTMSVKTRGKNPATFLEAHVQHGALRRVPHEIGRRPGPAAGDTRQSRSRGASAPGPPSLLSGQEMTVRKAIWCHGGGRIVVGSFHFARWSTRPVRLRTSRC